MVPIGYKPLSFLKSVNDGDHYVELFILGETYDIPRLRRDVLEQLVRFFNRGILGTPGGSFFNWLSAKVISRVYRHTLRNSPIRNIVADTFCQHGLGKDQDLLQEVPHDFLLDITKAYSQLADDQVSSEGILCLPMKPLRLCDYQQT